MFFGFLFLLLFCPGPSADRQQRPKKPEYLSERKRKVRTKKPPMADAMTIVLIDEVCEATDPWTEFAAREGVLVAAGEGGAEGPGVDWLCEGSLLGWPVG